MNKGFKGFPGSVQGLMQQAQKMRQAVSEAQARAEEIRGDASVGGGAVMATASTKNLISLKIKPDVINPADSEMLEDLVIAAVNEALNKANAEASEIIKKATGGIQIPGF